MLRWFVCLSVAMVTGNLYYLWNSVIDSVQQEVEVALISLQIMQMFINVNGQGHGFCVDVWHLLYST